MLNNGSGCITACNLTFTHLVQHNFVISTTKIPFSHRYTPFFLIITALTFQSYQHWPRALSDLLQRAIALPAFQAFPAVTLSGTGTHTAVFDVQFLITNIPAKSDSIPATG